MEGEKRTRSRAISFRLNETELETFNKQATSRRMTKSMFFRYMLENAASKKKREIKP